MPATPKRTAWPDLHKLRLFAAVAEHEHYSRAAELLGISQPVLTVHVRDLERHFGMPLFERAGRNVRLTDGGRLVLDYAQRVLALVSELEEAIADLREVRGGELRLGASTTIGNYLLPGLLGAFHAQHPGVSIAIEIANTGQIADQVRRGALHLGLVGEPLEDGELVTEPFRDDELVLVAPPGHAWAGRTIPVRDLAGVPLIVRERGSATRDVADAALATRGVRSAIALELGGTEAVKSAVAAGLGLAFASACAVDLEVQTGRLARVVVAGLEIRRQFQVLRRRSRRLSAAEAAILAALRSSAPSGSDSLVAGEIAAQDA